MQRRLFFLLFLLASRVSGGDLYTTDFEAFPVGDNQWAGTEGWISNDTTSGAQGIVQDFVAELPLGKTAYLGSDPPASVFTTVARPVNYDPAVAAFPVSSLSPSSGCRIPERPGGPVLRLLL